LWDVATGKEKRTLKKEQPHWAWVWGLALDASGKHLAVAHNHGVVRVWDMTSGKLLQEISGLESPPRGVTFARDGKLAVSDHGGTLRLYDPATLAEKARFKLGPRHGLVGSVCASPDGRVLATGNADGTLSLVEAP
jgi:WD40 repeat protein